MGDRLGKLTEVVGRVAGDRTTEARGRVAQDVADPEDPTDTVTDEAVEDKVEEVRIDHGDIDPATAEPGGAPH